MNTITLATTLVQIQCPCGGIYAISQSYRDEAYRLGNFQKCWTCPYCKSSRGYGESEQDRFNKQIEGMKKNERWLCEDRDRIAKRADRLERSRNATKGVLTRVKNRIKNGVCPCCQRTFQNLAAHMKGQHPDFVSDHQPSTENSQPD